MNKEEHWIEETIAYLNTNTKAAVTLPTGRGKTYGSARIANEVLDKRGRLLFVAPTRETCNKFARLISEGIELHTVTYTYLHLNIELYTDELIPDMIILDEYHRAGAREWGKSIELLFEISRAKVLGITATHIRSFGQRKDVRERFFQKHTTVEESMIEAIDAGYLNKPTLIRAGVLLPKNVKKKLRELRKSERTKSSREYALMRSVSRFQRIHKVQQGLPGILETYLTNDRRKIIAFCPTVSSLKTYERYLRMAFHAIGKEIKTLTVVGTMQRQARDRTLAQAISYDGPNILILLSVNILSESFHHPDFTTGIIFRRTDSSLRYFQMMGRAILPTRHCAQEALIIDMTDTLESLKMDSKDEIKAIPTNKDLPTHSTSEFIPTPPSDYQRIPNAWFSTLQVVDQRVHIAALSNILRIDSGEWNANAAKLLQYVNEHNSLPDKDSNLYGFLRECKYLSKKDFLLPYQRRLLEAGNIITAIPRHRTLDTIEEYVLEGKKPACTTCNSSNLVRRSRDEWICSECNTMNDVLSNTILRCEGIDRDLVSKAVAIYSDSTYRTAGIVLNAKHFERCFALPRHTAERLFSTIHRIEKKHGR